MIIVSLLLTQIIIESSVPHRSIALRVPSYGWGNRMLNVECCARLVETLARARMLNFELFAATHAIKSCSIGNGCLGNIELPLFFIENVLYLRCCTEFNV